MKITIVIESRDTKQIANALYNLSCGFMADMYVPGTVPIEVWHEKHLQMLGHIKIEESK